MKIKTKSHFSQALMALLSLLFLITSVNLLQNIGGGTTDLSENSIAQAPTNTTYWIDDTTQTALGVDFDRYTLRRDTSASTTTYLIQSEKDLAFLSWTIYNNKAYNNHKSGSYFYSGITFKQTKDLNLSAYYWQPIGIDCTRDGTFADRSFSGNYDGGGHTVSGVYTPKGDDSGYSYQGLFGYVYGQNYSTVSRTISNIGVIDSFIQGYQYIGGVVGYALGNSLSITNCYNTGTVSGSSSYVGGVVGDTSSVTITNCYNTGSVSGGSNVGGVVGSSSNTNGGTIINCYNTGAVSGSGGGTYVGGVLGGGGSISNCYNTGSVSGSRYVGGVAGTGNVTNCYNIGSVTGNERVGGVSGALSVMDSIENCYNTGSVKGTSSNVGGVVGYCDHSSLYHSYNVGSVSGGSNVGGVVGFGGYSTRVRACYNTGTVDGDAYVGGVVGRLSDSTVETSYYGGDCEASIGGVDGADVDGQAEYLADLEVLAKNEEWYLDSSNWGRQWDFENVWSLKVENIPNYIEAPNNGYPFLQCFDTEIPEHEIIYWTDEYVQTKLGVDFDNYSLTKDTSASATTYLIQSETDLAYLSWTIYNDNPFGGSSNKVLSDGTYYFYSNLTFKQTKDLDLSDYYWQPIGVAYTREGASVFRAFSGNYDGDGYTVSGVFTPEGTGNGYSYQGLFGAVVGRDSTQLATLQNIGVIDSFIYGYQYVGGVASVAQNIIVSNCYNDNGSVISTWTEASAAGYSYVGGIVGYAYGATITNCYNTGSVSGGGYVGGVVGYAQSSATITNCYNTGSVSGNGSVGGVVGYAQSSSTITNCYNTGAISGEDKVGGVAGYAYSLTITGSYNTGSVSGEYHIGGIVGMIYSGTIQNCLNFGNVIGNSNVGGICGGRGYYLMITIENCGVEGAVISGSSNVGIFVGSITNSSTAIENCYAIVDETLSPYGTNSGTFTNCLWIAGGVKYRYGTDFSGFAWFNPSSCPIPKGLALAGQFWTGDITNEIMASSGWTEWVA